MFLLANILSLLIKEKNHKNYKKLKFRGKIMILLYLITGLLPLILYTICYYYRGPIAGVIVGVSSSLIILLITLFIFGIKSGELLLLSASVLFMGGLSLLKKEDIYFKLQPFISNLVIIGFLIWLTFFKVSFWENFINMLVPAIGSEHFSMLSSTEGLAVFIRLIYYSIFWIFIHSGILLWTALKSRTFVWLLAKILFIPSFVVLLICSEWVAQYLNFV
jgi:hypothetical protein